MNKKEANEIKKLFTPAGCAITRICGCYVDAEKNKKTELKEAFLSLQEEEECLLNILPYSETPFPGPSKRI